MKKVYSAGGPLRYLWAFALALSLAIRPALAQPESITAPYALSDQIILNMIAGFAEVWVVADGFQKQYNIPADDLVLMLAGFEAHPDALAATNAVAARYGFSGIREWLQAYLAIAGAAMFADTGLTAEQRALMTAMVASMAIFDANLILVRNHITALLPILQP
jgi:hypothetical protein